MNLYEKSRSINITPKFDLSCSHGVEQRDWYLNHGNYAEEGGLPRGKAGQRIWPVIASVKREWITSFNVYTLVMETNTFGPNYLRVMNALDDMVDLGLIERKQVSAYDIESDDEYRVLNLAQVDFYPARLYQAADNLQDRINQVFSAYELAKKCGKETGVQPVSLDVQGRVASRRKFKLSRSQKLHLDRTGSLPGGTYC